MQKEANELKPKNLTKEQTDEFFKVYRILHNDLSEFENFMTEQKKNIKQAEEDAEGLELVIRIVDKALNTNSMDEESEKLKSFLGKLQKSYEQASEYVNDMNEQIGSYEERYERAKQFFQDFKEQVEILDDKGTCVVHEKALFMVEYLNSLGQIMEPEEREKLRQQQKQQG